MRFIPYKWSIVGPTLKKGAVFILHNHVWEKKSSASEKRSVFQKKKKWSSIESSYIDSILYFSIYSIYSIQILKLLYLR